MYGVIASVLGSSTPEPDLKNFINEIGKFESEYTEERDVLSALREVHAVEPRLIPSLRQQPVGLPITVDGMPETLFRKIEPALDRLKKRGLLTWNYSINGLGFAAPGSSGGGNFGALLLTITPTLAAALKRSEFS